MVSSFKYNAKSGYANFNNSTGDVFDFPALNFGSLGSTATPAVTPVTTTPAAPSGNGFFSSLLSAFQGSLPGVITGLEGKVLNGSKPTTGIAADINAVCGKQPMNLGPFNKAARDKYDQCAQGYAAAQLSAQAAASNAQAAALAASQKTGLSGLAITGIVVGSLLAIGGIAFGIYKATR